MDGRKEPWLAGALEVAFRDPAKKRLYQTESRKAIAHKLTTRTFDHFDFLLPQPELMQLAKDYFVLLRNIKYFVEEDGQLARLEISQLNHANKLLTEIINIGILELFDPPNHLRSELVKVLNWDEITSNINKIRLLCAYVGGVFGCIYVKYPKSLDENKQARPCAEKYLHENCKKTIISILLQRKFITQAEAEEEESPSENESIFISPVVTASIVTVTLAALAALAFGIYAAVTSSRNNRAEETKREAPQTQKAGSAPGPQ